MAQDHQLYPVLPGDVAGVGARTHSHSRGSVSPRAGQGGHPYPWRVADGSGNKPGQQTLFRLCSGNAESKELIGRDA